MVIDDLRRALAGRYRLERELGAGGMAAVYLAEDLRHPRRVAIKVLHPQVAALLGPERFRREIATLAGLQHPYILSLIDSGEAAGHLYFVMPAIEGRTLRDRLEREGRLPVEDAVRITLEAADGLAYAHRKGVVHRDVKPENILLDGAHAVVGDFGIAQAETFTGPRMTEPGTGLGTPLYMSPEQAVGGTRVDGRSDVFSLASVLYEMLTGATPFKGATTQALIANIVTGDVPRPGGINPAIPAAVEAVILRGLARAAEDRYPTMQAFGAALERAVRPPAFGPWARRAVAAGAVVTIAGFAWLLNARAANRRAERALPQIVHLIEQGDYRSAFALAELVGGRHPLLEELWPRMSAALTVTSTPPGAAVSLRPYSDTAAAWEPFGVTPVTQRRVALGAYAMRFALAGYDTLETMVMTPEVAREVLLRQGDSLVVRPDSFVAVQLLRSDTARGMVAVPVGALTFTRRYSSERQTFPTAPFRIQRHEVTNAEYQGFVDAGGYQDSSWWPAPIRVEGRVVSFAVAMAQFHDRSGRPAPATWEGGAFPAGTGLLPVGGISWFEAVAYARFRGLTLPTIYHWSTAAGYPADWGVLVGSSNVERDSAASVVGHHGVGRFGTTDMLGNVKEWAWNATDGSGAFHYVMGGSWRDPMYFAGPDVRAAWDRSPDNGVRLVALPPGERAGGGAMADTLTAPTTMWAIGRRLEQASFPAVSDEVFATYRDLVYGYTPAPLNDSILSVDETSRLWRREVVSFAAAYGGERVKAYLFIPRGVAPPYQTVVYVPSGLAWNLHDSRFIGKRQSQHDYFWEFVAMSGRAVLYPVVKGTYERWQRPTLSEDPNFDRTQMIEDVQDVRRAVDYLVTRREIDPSKLAYYGVSSGAVIGPIVAALEPRFKTAVFLLQVCLAEPFEIATAPVISPVRFLPRVKSSVLAISGDHDYVFSDGRDCLIRQMDRLGTPPADRRLVLYPGGHGIWGAFGHESRGEILQWLDSRFGPVRSDEHVGR
jgi:eukaryotic-like serine/threonine-protein kinase